ncbi:MAG: hypothetical protein GY703_06595 [Gammaproteobacteria bacterium]|nr:hypothetical protein [Gammaproteobacteria bacterium]
MNSSFFADAVVVHAYTRSQALQDGGLIDVTETAREAGFRVPVALTAAAWGDCVAWNSQHEAACQDESGRLCDVLTIAGTVIRHVRGDRAVFSVLRIPRGGRQPELARLVIHIGPGDRGEPVVTIMQPGED